MLRALPILLLAGLGGCTYNPHEDFSPDFGEAVHANMASQVINPVPLRPSGRTVNSGVRMDAAYQRYQTNRITKPGPVPALQAATGGAAGDAGSGPATGGGPANPN